MTRVGEPTVVVSVPKPTVNQFAPMFGDHDLGQVWPVREALYSMVDTVEAVSELVKDVVSKVVEEVFEEGMERLFGVGDVLRDVCAKVGYEVEKEQLTGAYEVLDDVCGRVEIEVDVEQVVCEMVNDVEDRIEDDERVWLNSVHVNRVCDTWKQGDVVKPVNEEQRVVLKRLREVYAGSEIKHIPSLKNKERKLVNAELSLVNGLMHNVVTKDDITEIQRLLYAGVYVTVERLGMMKDRKGGKRKADKDPWWKRRIEESIKKWRKDLGLVDAYKRGNLKNAEERARLERAYGLGAKGYLS